MERVYLDVCSLKRPFDDQRHPREDRRLTAALWIDGAAIDVPLDAEVEVRAGDAPRAVAWRSDS